MGQSELHLKKWKLLELLNWSVTLLAEADIKEARLTAERLLAHVLGANRIDLYLNFNQPLSVEETERLFVLLKRRLANEPLQYILGETEFMSLRFKVTPSTLIPRPETEVLVENAITQAKRIFAKEKRISCLDIGTGCGNIAISLAHYLKNCSGRGVDIDQEAIKIAGENAVINNVSERVQFLQADVIDKNFAQEMGGQFEMVVSNPPYVSESEYNKLPAEIQKCEPKIALDGGPDGLRFYRAIKDHIARILKTPGLALFEIGYQQAKSVADIFAGTFKGKIQILPDLAGRDRIVVLSQA